MIVRIYLQARVSSTRLPAKVLREYKGKPLLWYVVRRLSLSEYPITVLTDHDSFAKLLPIVKDLNYREGIEVSLFAGELHDVLKRFVQALNYFPADIVIRATADNPFVDIPHLKMALEHHIRENADITYYVDLPVGTGVEILNPNALIIADKNAGYAYQREHVTPYIKSHPEVFKILELTPDPKYRHPEIRLTIDELVDFELFMSIMQRLGDRIESPLDEILKLLK